MERLGARDLPSVMLAERRGMTFLGVVAMVFDVVVQKEVFSLTRPLIEVIP